MLTARPFETAFYEMHIEGSYIKGKAAHTPSSIAKFINV
jgi:hypothetical protein